MDLDAKKILKTLNPRRVWIPIALASGILAFLFVSDPDISFSQLALIREARFLPLVLALTVTLARFFGYVQRIRIISDRELEWIPALYVIILWEFASAVTPSVVGGTAVAMFILWKEGIKLGKAFGFVMLTAILDNMYFVVFAPLSLLLGPRAIFPETETAFPEGSLFGLFALSYALITLYTLIMVFALLINPRAVKWLLIKVTALPVLRRWRHAAHERGNELIAASAQIRGKTPAFWRSVILLTVFIWTSRYLLLNCLIAAFSTTSWQSHLLVLGKQIVLWVIMLISPTPGSSGVAELVFPMFFSDMLSEYTMLINILWRIFTFFIFLFLGAIILPRWLQRVFFKKKNPIS